MTVTALPRRLRARKPKPERPEVNGHKIRFRAGQQLAWTALGIALGAGFIAGLYWFGFEQNWHYIFPFLRDPTSAKAWWDGGMGFIHSAHWPPYRHGIRDNGEPEYWTMIGGTLLGAAAPNARRLSLWLVPAAGLVMLVLVVAFAVGITWLTTFGPLRAWPDSFHWQQLVLGIAAGRLLHYLWLPVGRTVQYHLVVNSAMDYDVMPLWVRLPLMPPTWRELWAELRAGRPPREDVPEDASKHYLARVLVPLGVTLFLAVAIVGDLAKWGFAHGLHVPILNP